MKQILIIQFHFTSHSKQAPNGIVCNRSDSSQRMEKCNKLILHYSQELNNEIKEEKNFAIAEVSRILTIP